MLAVTKDSTLQLDDAIVLHAIPELEKYWAFNIESGDQYTLNDSAFYLLSLFRDPKKVTTALADFSGHYDIDVATAEEDGLPLLNDYKSQKFFKGDEDEK